ncbi:SUMF1/EgtB/PvdO family nonheme iron enzyme [Chitinophaga sp. CF418]|uniref:SUMF1/EgtB/PvdO family nonheme iron enzyme n=1 Tax=Chitinophaga sp. CF418 TaxID=1855287 RepID=UPI00091509C1|nr:SUMF1/EgtB/PvdO family nonheme iron enzyme [Chitinophaga sp. CF418]SHN00185.1 Formylglycine-generating enzyme, required for sulfatase activity, contains SUMF1/FGE domain [Chitinophaga sp. CF418]
MRKLFKYDVAISVAEENRDIAEQIVAALKKRRIPHYYYENDVAGSWGEYIMNLTKDAYGKHARYILLITSRFYVEKYWSGVELQVAVSNFVTGRPRVLQLRLDDTPVDSISKHQVYLEWKNNPEEIAGILKEKIKRQKHAALRRKLPLFICIAILIITAVISYYISWLPGRHRWPPLPPPQAEKVLITGMSILPENGRNTQKNIDSFYISNTEVTLAQYRKFCESQQKSFPPQPPSSDENGPVRNVTWYEALEYCKWVQGRLPTEAEWEYAASAGLAVRYSGSNNAGKVAVYNKQKPLKVASKEPNAFKLYDMTGNVAEWCDNWSDSTLSWKAVRGGSYNSKINPVNELDLTYRTKEHPDIRNPYIGFRVAWNSH